MGLFFFAIVLNDRAVSCIGYFGTKGKYEYFKKTNHIGDTLVNSVITDVGGPKKISWHLLWKL